ncbi:MAG: biotin/lipoyl-containing protein, partial [Acidobacteriota bacterium]
TGTLHLWREPQLPGVRVDSGVREGDAMTVHYDPMLAKVIARAEDRATALDRLRRALEELAVAGVANNRRFLLEVLGHPDVRAGATHTRFVDERRADLHAAPPGDDVTGRHAMAATLYLIDDRRRLMSPTPTGIQPGWRNNRWRWADQRFTAGGLDLKVHYRSDGPDKASMRVGDGPASDVRRLPGDAGAVVFEVDGLRTAVHVGAARGEIDGAHGVKALAIHGAGVTTELTVTPRFPARAAAAVAGGCAAPMTGLVLDVRVVSGDRVAVGDTLVVLEAMKMEHSLLAAHDGTVTTVHVKKGQMVDPDEVLVVLEADASTEVGP